MPINLTPMKISRAPLSPEIRSLLIAFMACDLQKPLRRVEVDWDQTLLALKYHRIIGPTYYCLRQLNEPEYPPPVFQQAVRALHYLNVAYMEKVYQYFKLVTVHLQEHSIDFIVLKGPAIAQLAAPEPAIRYFRDLDLMIRERNWKTTDIALNAAGFFVEEGIPNPLPKIMPQVNPKHDTKYFFPKTRFTVEIHYEDLLNDGLAARNIEGFWNRAVLVPIEGVVVKSLSLEDHLLQLCGHAHGHAYTQLCLVSDLVFILRDHAHQLDWDLFLRTVTREEAQVPVYYSLRLVANLFGIYAPPDVMKAVYPDGFRRWWHERYLPEKRMNTLSIKHEATFSFKNRPLFTSAIFNILIMGRRSEKIQYLLHLLFPPAEWIRYTYGLSANRILAPYYLLHPFKLLFNALWDTILGIFSKGIHQP